MPGRPPKPEFRLPRHWSRRIRSAIIHAISLAQFALTCAHARATHSRDAGDRHTGEIDRLGQEFSLLREEMRLKDARMQRIPGHRRPYYQPIERLAILELRAARGWSLSQTADRMLLTPATVASWMGRLDEEGPQALVQMRQPVNKFPDFVAYLVRRLKVLCPAMGKIRIAQVLARAGLHLGATTVARMLAPRPWPPKAAIAKAAGRRVQATRPNHIWLVDLTTVPTAAGLWASWLPFALPQAWPFCWWVAVVVDHFSRRILGFAVFEQNPTSRAVRQLLGRAIREAGHAPAHLITDQGTQFTDDGFRSWCGRRRIRQRFGAVGKYGSIAVIERLIRTMKNECTRKFLIAYRRSDLKRELALFVAWYNCHRPHSTLGARSPDEVYYDLPPACLAPRYEPRRSWPRGSPCAAPQAKVSGRRGQRLELKVSYFASRKHLPIVELKKAA